MQRPLAQQQSWLTAHAVNDRKFYAETINFRGLLQSNGRKDQRGDGGAQRERAQRPDGEAAKKEQVATQLEGSLPLSNDNIPTRAE